ncbi:hypothetical protein HHL16_15150 [Pseudoflavitalea sp. G-6-1-2]|uniref:hypothetical protein n=1 Tax=Pseudoflavitalea sp. G-6-1-2 TaxID=2728841 RepID=UPI00146E49BD|nr:hypothetical protein [Pseudoflavitalea sp. G-6-1-2]NML22219.1 hypothetical protein [Pseudoflavitalea sp. G-6-1-2]
MMKYIESNDKGDIIYVHTGHDTVLELKDVEDYYFKILCLIFLKSPIVLITIKPQNYSFTQGMENNYILKANNTELLVSEISNFGSELLNAICQEEEFKRGLLLLVSSKKKVNEGEISSILSAVNNNAQSLPLDIKVAYSESDGNTLCLLNSGLNSETLLGL